MPYKEDISELSPHLEKMNFQIVDWGESYIEIQTPGNLNDITPTDLHTFSKYARDSQGRCSFAPPPTLKILGGNIIRIESSSMNIIYGVIKCLVHKLT